MNTIARTAALGLTGCLAALALAACGPDVADDRPGGGPIVAAGTTTTTGTTTTSATTTTTTTPPAATTGDESTTTTTSRSRPGVSSATVLAEFKQLVREHCAPAFTGGDTHVPMPTARSAKLKSGNLWLIRDDENADPMLFDRVKQIVTSQRGPQGSLGQTYVFQCDPEIFVSPVS